MQKSVVAALLILLWNQKISDYVNSPLLDSITSQLDSVQKLKFYFFTMYLSASTFLGLQSVLIASGFTVIIFVEFLILGMSATCPTTPSPML